MCGRSAHLKGSRGIRGHASKRGKFWGTHGTSIFCRYAPPFVARSTADALVHMVDACPLGLAYSTSALQTFASPALGELDEQDLAEVSSLLRRSQRPANRAFLAALCST